MSGVEFGGPSGPPLFHACGSGEELIHEGQCETGDAGGLCSHPVFGQWRPLVNKVLTFCDRGAEILGPFLPVAAEFSRAFAEADDLRRFQVCMHPCVRDVLGGALVAYRQGRLLESEDNHEVLHSAARALRSGEVQEVPFYGGETIGDRHHSLLLWSELWNGTSAGRHFQRLFEREIASSVSSQRAALVQPDDTYLQTLQNGYDLLSTVAPALSESVLPHVRVICIIDYENIHQRIGRVRTDLCQNVSTHAVPGTIFLSPSPFRSPLHAAEAILHEAAHKKLSDLVLTERIFRENYNPDDAPTVKSIWNSWLPWNTNEWSIDRALFAYHVYVYLTAFFDAVRQDVKALNARFGIFPGIDPDAQYIGALNRAMYLDRQIRLRGQAELGVDGHALMEWLQCQLEYWVRRDEPPAPDLILWLDRYDRDTKELTKVLRMLPEDKADRGDWTPDAQYEGWPLRRTVCHLIHSEIVGAYRVLSVLGGSIPPQLPFYDGERWSALASASLPFKSLAEIFSAVRSFTSATLRSAGPAAANMSFKTRRPKVLLELVGDMVEHAQRHMAQLLGASSLRECDGDEDMEGIPAWKR